MGEGGVGVYTLYSCAVAAAVTADVSLVSGNGPNGLRSN